MLTCAHVRLFSCENLTAVRIDEAESGERLVREGP